jgi:hypothetical protein
MTANYVLLEKITVGAAGASSVTFSGIPQTGYTDLVIKASVRSDKASTFADLTVKFNGSASSYTNRLIYGEATSAGSYLNNYANQGYITTMNAASSTSSTFTSTEIYIPNYTSANNKSFSDDGVTENNATSSYAILNAGLWSNTAAITSIELLTPSGNFVANTTFYLYGVAKLGTTPAIVPYATGGDTIMTDGTYWYHAFKASGTFTPAKALSCDVLVVAGGGSGATMGLADVAGGGGGAGGIIGFASQSLTATGYTVTIGAGASAPGSAAVGVQGSNSVFGGLTTAIGGGGGGYYTDGGNGGSGGGAGGDVVNHTGGTATSGQGNAGGNMTASGGQYSGGGGGGYGAVGGNAAGAGGTGGAGTNTVTTYGSLTNTLTATGLGVSGYIAGGGGGGGRNVSAGAGGSGGGGAGGQGGGGGKISDATNGTANTGSGGGGAGSGSSGSSWPGGNGGSGLIIVRYAV